MKAVTDSACNILQMHKTFYYKMFWFFSYSNNVKTMVC